MFIELVDALRCPVPHEESWLVAAAVRMESRHIVEGTLGCPVCSAEYPIRDGVVDFRRAGGSIVASSAPREADLALRMAALLNLADAQGFAVLLGEWGAQAHELASLVETPLVLVDPPAGIVGGPGVSVVRCDGEIPLAIGTARAMALDDGSTARVASAVRATRTKGRIMAPVSVSVPEAVTELARDETMWVGERNPVQSPLLTLHVRRST